MNGSFGQVPSRKQSDICSFHIKELQTRRRGGGGAGIIGQDEGRLVAAPYFFVGFSRLVRFKLTATILVCNDECSLRGRNYLKTPLIRWRQFNRSVRVSKIPRKNRRLDEGSATLRLPLSVTSCVRQSTLMFNLL